MISRNLSETLEKVARHYPVVTVTGPRQSGKTTLCRAIFPELHYVSFDELDVREYARTDPRGFLAEHERGAVLDEIQHAPHLLSYLKVSVDTDDTPGRFVLTGSQHFGLMQAVTESLAGRTAVLHLLPLSIAETHRFGRPDKDLFETLFTGGFPRVWDREIPAARWLADYVTTYVERDVRQVLGVQDLHTFSTFLGLCAGRTAQPMNLSALGSDAGISHNTARSWLSVLEASYVCFRAPAHHRSTRKQLMKSPKMHFFDTGLACHLLGIREPRQLRQHPLRGAIFESWVASEIYKARANAGLPAALHHYREARGAEVDIVLTGAGGPLYVEVKSGATISASFLEPLHRLVKATGGEASLVYGGTEGHVRSGVRIIPWREVDSADWLI